jgi:hypothetical protein
MKDAAVWRVNANGTLAWCRKIGTGNVDWTLDITAISPGGFYVAIRSVDPNNWQGDSTSIIKLDAGGNILWMRRYTPLQSGVVCNLQSTSNGGFVMLTMEDSGSYESCANILACDGNGNLLWSKMFVAAGSYKRASLTQLANGDIAVAITVGAFSTAPNLTLIRISGAGAVIWSKEYPLSQWEAVQGLVTSGFDLYLSTAINGGSHQVYKFDLNGMCLWSRNITFPSFIHYAGVTGMAFSNGKICMVGSAHEWPANYMEGLLIEFDTAGNLLNSGFLFTGVNTILYDVVYNSAGDMALTGFVRSGITPSDTSSMFLAVGLPSAGTICGYFSYPVTVANNIPVQVVPVNMNATVNGYITPATLATSTGSFVQYGCIVGLQEIQRSEASIYPNPAREFVTIETTNEQRAISFYNNLGQCVLERKLTGTRNEISLEGLVDGVYCFRITEESGKTYSDIIIVQ